MPDTIQSGGTDYISGGSSKGATQLQVQCEWAELRPALDKIALQAQALIASLRDLPRPLYADERVKADQARVAFAEQVLCGIEDLMGDLTSPVRHRADDLALDPDAFAIDLSEVHEEYAALAREASQMTRRT